MQEKLLIVRRSELCRLRLHIWKVGQGHGQGQVRLGFFRNSHSLRVFSSFSIFFFPSARSSPAQSLILHRSEVNVNFVRQGKRIPCPLPSTLNGRWMIVYKSVHSLTTTSLSLMIDRINGGFVVSRDNGYATGSRLADKTNPRAKGCVSTDCSMETALSDTITYTLPRKFVLYRRFRVSTLNYETHIRPFQMVPPAHEEVDPFVCRSSTFGEIGLSCDA